MDRLKDFSKVKVLIVGDIMIDRYWWGSVERVSPEAPVPVVRLNDTTMVAGGAANVAANVAGLGAQPFLIGAVGCDEESKIFPELLARSGVGSELLLKMKDRPTTVKTRVIAHSQQVARIDQESCAQINSDDEEMIWKIIEKTIKNVDAVIISDYAKGLLSQNLLSRLITISKELNKTILVDPKGKSFHKYKNADVITPNKREIAEACELDDFGDDSIVKCGEKLLDGLNLEAVLVTLGEKGMMLLEKGKNALHLAASARKVYDVTGAGDTVIATLAVALGSRMNFVAAAELANIAAGLVVEKVGTTRIEIINLKKELERSNKLKEKL